MPVRPELAADYYLHNFQLLLDGVQWQYGDLLSTSEHLFIDTFNGCDKPARQLYVRLLSRKGELFRRDKLDYPEIPDLDQAARQLAAAGLLVMAPDLELAELLPLLTKPELIGLFTLPAASRYQRRQALEALLLAQAPHPPELPFTHYRLLQKEHLICFRLLFFGNPQQDLTEFVLLDLGLYRYEDYPLLPDARLFRERGMIDASLALLQLQQALHDCGRDHDTLLALNARLPDAYPWPAIEYQRAGLLNRLARELERCDEPELASALYRQSERPPARERQARLLDKRGQSAAALALCHRIQAAPLDSQELEFADTFSRRLQRKLGGPVSRINKPQFQQLRLQLPPATGRVELAVRDHFARQGPCFYCENSLMTALFGLTFWDAIFAPVAGAFFNPYQSGPLDLFSNDFYPRRRERLDALLAGLWQPDWPDSILARFRAKRGVNNGLVDWKRVDEELLSLAVARIPRPHLTAFFQHMLFDLKNCRSGLPDLILFPDAGGYRLLEVKGPGDSLQDNQKRWLSWFNQHEIPYAVCYVEWTE